MKVVIFLLLTNLSKVVHGLNSSKCFQDVFCIPTNYNKHNRPIEDTVVIGLDIDIIEVLAINDQDFSTTVMMYIGANWEEPRLMSNKSTKAPVDLSLIDDLWIPDLYIYNMKKFRTERIWTDLAGLFVQGNTIMYNMEATVTVYCPMRFDDYPMDKQHCPLQVGSYIYNSSFMMFQLSKLEDLNEYQTSVLDYDIQKTTLQEKYTTFTWFVNGKYYNYSLTGFEIHMQRKIGNYLVNFYLPSSLFVAVSWASFLIPPDMVPGRMALLVTLFLVLTNIFTNAEDQSVVSTSTNMLSIWLLACIFFVFGALVAYAGILSIRYKSYELQESKTLKWLKTIDVAFFLLFPTIFGVFNLVYWYQVSIIEYV